MYLIIVLAFILTFGCNLSHAQTLFTTDDTFIASDGNGDYDADGNYGGRASFAISAQGHRSRAMLKFDMDDIEENHQIESASLALIPHQIAGREERTLIFCLLEEDWDEDEATWNNCNDIFGEEIGELSVRAFVRYEFDLTDVVTDWYNGEIENFGIGIIAANEGNDNLVSFCSNEWDEGWNVGRPRLTVESNELERFEVIGEIPDVNVEEDEGRSNIIDLNEVFVYEGDGQLQFEHDDELEELNLGIDDDLILFIDPAENFNIPDSVVLTVTAIAPDERELSDEFTVTIAPVNDDPTIVVVPDSVEIQEGDEGEIIVFATDVDLFFEGDDCLTSERIGQNCTIS